jgi:4-amino-4-deoxy-L-arabinose transferase-like glycosyltransferase
MLKQRTVNYALLLIIGAALTFPGLGVSLWDIDEGNNSEAAREMLESENWIVPTFNYQLRTDKPALLYWLQVMAYKACGVNELAARLPSALAGLLTLLVVYELARRMFGPSTAVISALILSTTVAFNAASRFANPDALLNLTIVLTFALFWQGFSSQGRWWLLAAGVTTGLAVLAKGPVGLALPAGTILLFLAWSHRLDVLWDRRLIYGLLLLFLTAAPWYIWVGVDTKANFLRGFWLQHNVGRYLQPMENHSGAIYYYLLVLLVGIFPWSMLLGPAVWFAASKRMGEDGTDAVEGFDSRLRYRFLWCWIALYLVFFTFAGTKLPNYILPVYAPISLLAGRCLDRWRRQEIDLSAWRLKLGFAGMGLVGIAIAVGALIAGGKLGFASPMGGALSGLEVLAFLGLPLVGGAITLLFCAVRLQRATLVGVWVGTGACFSSALFGWGGTVMDNLKGPRGLVEESHACQPRNEIRVGCYEYFQPSLVFYCRREVERCTSDEKAIQFLANPLEVYLFVPEAVWERIKTQAPASAHQVAAHWDLYRRARIAVICNRDHNNELAGLSGRQLTLTSSRSNVRSVLGGIPGG